VIIEFNRAGLEDSLNSGLIANAQGFDDWNGNAEA
jgi:hypothetical protein